MRIRIFFLLLILCTGCQFGRIPCPKTKEAKLRKHFRPSPLMLSARANQEQEREFQHQRPKEEKSDTHFIKNVSVEEWDCPKPGTKKYMPKSVKDNIRKNKKRVEAGRSNEAQLDSLSNQ